MTTAQLDPTTDFDLPDEIEAEIQNYEAHVRRFQRDEIDPLEFRLFRLQHGIYGQRQPDVHMIRVKIPYGGLDAEQVDMLADIIDRYAPRRVGHLTTRQDLQMHFVPLDKTPTVMRLLSSVGLTTREACGNTVRNVTADHLSGVGPDEAFDVTPYAKAVSAHCLRLDVCQLLPRKFKPAFSASDHDFGLVPMHDIGFVARTREVDGRVERGFKVVVGGGLGAAPHLAETLDEFLPANEVARITEAVLTVFNANGPRKNRNKARIKFYIKSVGIEQFRLQVREALEQLPPADDPHFRQVAEFMDLEEEAPTTAPRLVRTADLPGDADFAEWKRTNLVPQTQDGFYAAYVTVPLGDLTVEQLHALADLTREFTGGRLRITAQQALILRWVREQDLADLYLRLGELQLSEPSAHQLADVMSCPGSDTCALGITSSKGLASVLRESIIARGPEDDLVERMRIKISGCPNSCGHHHMADIGFHGAAMHADGRLVPSFNVLIGGGADIDGSAIARIVGKVPAKRVADAVNMLVDDYKAGRDEGEIFRRYSERRGLKYFRGLLQPFSAPPKFTDNPLMFVDHEANKLFNLDEMGEGECAV